MGAWFRGYERNFERRLSRRRGQGVREPAQRSHDDAAAGQDSSDVRTQIPPLGLREYWYPALPASKVGRKPVYWVMLGDELAFFRDEQGQVVALTDVCPHRGASLSHKDNAF